MARTIASHHIIEPNNFYTYFLNIAIDYLDHLCYLCLVFVMLSRLFIAALWSPEGKGLAFWLLSVMFIVILFFSHSVSWDQCGT